MRWTEEDEKLFRLALSLRQELDPARFDNYFFDASVVYVYVSRVGGPFEILTNLVHEMGHALLADTPAGFVLQSLFQLAATTADYLWQNYLAPSFQGHLEGEQERGKRREQITQLEAGGLRPLAQRDRAKEEAQALIQRSGDTIRKSLDTETAQDLVRMLLALQERRELLINASRVCHEALATFTQLHEHASTFARYNEVIEHWVPLPERERMRAMVPEELRARRNALHGVWKAGFDLAVNVAAKTGLETSVPWAAHVAHHFAYPGCDLLDMDLKSFAEAVNSPLLSVDLRFQSLCAAPEEVKRGQERKDGGKDVLARVLGQCASSSLDEGEKSFQRWHTRHVLGSEICRSLRELLPMNAQAASGVNDHWSEYLLKVNSPRTPPPVLFDDGQVLSPSPLLTVFVKQDFVRAVRLRSVLKTLSHVVLN